MKPGSSTHTWNSGFTYIALLVLLAIMGIGLAATGIVFHHQAQREKEKQLLFVGEQIRHAIGRYYENSPGGGKQFPQTLENLLRDDRHPGTHRYLRQVYRDPMTNAKDWVLLRARLLNEYAAEEDSLRFYFLDESSKQQTEHHGIRAPINLEGPLII